MWTDGPDILYDDRPDKVAGLYIGGGGSAPAPQPTSSTTTVRNDPWSGVQGYLTDLILPMAEAGLLGDPSFSVPQFFPQSTVVPFAPQTNTGLGLMESRALFGNPVVDAAQNQAGSTLTGGGFGSPAESAYGPYAFGGMLGQNAAYPFLGPYASGANFGLNPAEFMAVGAGQGQGPGAGLQPFASGAMQGSNLAFPYLNPAAGGANIGADPAQGLAQQYAGGGGPGSFMEQFASGGMTGANPGYGLLNPFATGGYFGINPGASTAGQLAQGGGAGSYLDQIAGGGPSAGGLLAGDVAQAGMGPGAPLYGQTAAGGFLGSNPYLDALYQSASNPLIEQFQNQIMPGITSQFGAAGRSGSGLLAQELGRTGGQLTDSLAQLSASIYAPAYEAERNRMLQATAGLQGAYDTQQGRRLQSAGLMGEDASRALQAAQGLGGLQMGGAGLLSDIFGRDVATQLGASGQVAQLSDAERARQLQAARDLGGFTLGGTGLLSNIFGRDVGQQLQAAQAMGGLSSEETAQRLQGASGLGQYGLGGMGLLNQIYGQDAANQMAAIGQMGGLSANEAQQQLQAIQGLGDMYGQERLNQMRAMSFAPQMANQDYTDISQLLGVGGAYQGQAGAELADLMSRFGLDQQYTDLGRLGIYSPYFQGYGGGSSTTNMTGMTPQFSGGSSPLLGALGGGMAGWQLGSMLGTGAGLAPMASLFGPAGAIGGALLGGLLL